MLIQNYKVYNLYKNLVVIKKFSNDHCCIMMWGWCRKKSRARITRGKKLITSVGIDRRARHKGNRGELSIVNCTVQKTMQPASVGMKLAKNEVSCSELIDRQLFQCSLLYSKMYDKQNRKEHTQAAKEKERERKESKEETKSGNWINGKIERHRLSKLTSPGSTRGRRNNWNNGSIVPWILIVDCSHKKAR